MTLKCLSGVSGSRPAAPTGKWALDGSHDDGALGVWPTRAIVSSLPHTLQHVEAIPAWRETSGPAESSIRTRCYPFKSGLLKAALAAVLHSMDQNPSRCPPCGSAALMKSDASFIRIQKGGVLVAKKKLKKTQELVNYITPKGTGMRDPKAEARRGVGRPGDDSGSRLSNEAAALMK